MIIQLFMHTALVSPMVTFSTQTSLNVMKISGEFHESGTLGESELVQIVFVNVVCSLLMKSTRGKLTYRPVLQMFVVKHTRLDLI